jgi:hypothetical protein
MRDDPAGGRRYATASEGWRTRPTQRVVRVGRGVTPGGFEREPHGVRHAVADGADRSVCGAQLVADLFLFPDVGFLSGPRADRCPDCERIASTRTPA